MASSTTPERPEDRRRSSTVARRLKREQEIIDATRRLFDERGVRDAQIEDIAKAVGINRAIVYRHFTGKEELFALTLVQYLDELRLLLLEAAKPHEAPRDRLAAMIGEFASYGMTHPAFVDCAQAIMRRPGEDLLAEVSEQAMFRLGRAISGCLSELTTVIESGVEAGDFQVDDPYLLTNMLYASGLGTLQLGRVGMLVTEVSPGIPKISRVSGEQVRDHMITSALAIIGAHTRAGG